MSPSFTLSISLTSFIIFAIPFTLPGNATFPFIVFSMFFSSSEIIFSLINSSASFPEITS